MGALRTLFRDGWRFGVLSPEYRAAGWPERLALASVLLIPFQYALTIPAGFPLKLSELLVVAAAAAWLLRWRRNHVTIGLDLLLAGVLAVWVLISTGFALGFADLATPLPGGDRPPAIDMVVYCAYALFVLVFWFLLRGSHHLLLRDVLIQSVWLALAAVLTQAAFMQIPGGDGVLRALGFDTRGRGQAILGMLFGRSGPFLEGQHLGFYAGAVFVVALFAKRWLSLAAASLCLLYSQSTTGLLGVAIAVVATLVLLPRKRPLIVLGAVAVVGAAVIAIVPALRSFALFQLAKLGIGTVSVNGVDAGRSLNIRGMKSDIGWKMMWDHPLLGVGPGRYAAHFYDYSDGYDVPPYYRSENLRVISENGYVHIGSELGLVALLIFAALLGLLLFRSWRARNAVGVAAGVFTAVGFATQSSWTFMPIWATLGLLAAIAADRGLILGDPPVPRGDKASR